MKKSVLLTRSNIANMELREQLSDKNLEFLECSLIDYKLNNVTAEYINIFSGLVITSNFAARNVPKPLKDAMPVWVVGEKSADMLRKKGYHIQFCAPSAELLRGHIPSHLPKGVLYLSGNHISVEMPEFVTRKVIYEVTYLNALSREQVLRYKQGIDYILLYSENCAKTLLRLLVENNLLNYLENTTIIAISSKVGSVFGNNFKNVVVAHSSELVVKYIK
ncbi:MAG: palindromic element RPE1 domain-containing protein [Rickettsiaceae bacterium]